MSLRISRRWSNSFVPLVFEDKGRRTGAGGGNFLASALRKSVDIESRTRSN